MANERDNTGLKALTETDRSEGIEFDLVELLYHLIEKFKWILLAAVLGALLAAAYTFFLVTPMYTATSGLYVLNANDSAINLSDLQIGSYLANDYKETFNNWHVQERVIQQLNLPYSYNQLRRMVSVTNPNDTRILYIRVTSASPDEAKAIADTYAHVAQDFFAETMETERPNIFQEALRPTIPSSPNRTMNILIGFILGAVIAAAVVIIQFISDDRIRTSDEIEKYLKIPTLGMMPKEHTGVDSQGAGKGGKK